MAPTLVLGVISLLLGIGLLYWIGRRKFNRTTPYGTQGFSSYNQRLAIPFIERIGRIVGRLLAILGILFLLVYYWQGKQKAKAAEGKTTTEKHARLEHKLFQESFLTKVSSLA
ncbi:molybdenum ABC transporter permease [Chitinophaga sp. GbtcB8]|uniref:molybdenum ABC transporter permease n=1 Tax=Chitinophaga sp. GbtcB8 TaxID=2824753 RepID=UPI001C309D30|nr:molybdenum ABC transporter permease [Chitinophaga sp. GbtcB8]